MGLWSAPVSGLASAGVSVALTASTPGVYYDNAVRAGGVIAVQHPVACGTEDIHVLGEDGGGTKLVIGGSLGSDHLVGADGDKIAVRSSTECGMPSWFGFVDPVSGASSIVLPGSADHRGPGPGLAFPAG